jgi:hypothetical protein
MQGSEVWLNREHTYLARPKPGVQTPVQPKKKRKYKQKESRNGWVFWRVGAGE